MRILLLALAIMLVVPAAKADDLVPPDVVRLENVRVDADMRTIYVGNANRHWVLFCNVKAAGCITPDADRNYLLFDAKTRWKMPGAKDFITLSFVQDWTVKYNTGENIGLVPEEAKGDLGMFLLDTTAGGYERDIIVSDGPIIYGTGMSDKDRQNAWKYFFFMVVKAVTEQQGKDALGVKLARRCLPNEEFCTIALDAMLVGIGRIEEPRKVAVIVASDVHDEKKLVARLVCTWPTKDRQVCRDWDTGKLVAPPN